MLKFTLSFKKQPKIGKKFCQPNQINKTTNRNHGIERKNLRRIQKPLKKDLQHGKMFKNY